MGVSEKEHDQKPHQYTVHNTTTVYRPTSLQFSIDELHPTIEDTEHRYRPSSAGSFTEDGVIDEYTYEYKDGKHGKTRNGHWKPSVREWLVLICVSAVVMMDAYNATVIVPMVPVCDHLSFSVSLSNSILDANLNKNTMLASIPRLWKTTREYPMVGHGISSSQRRSADRFPHACQNIFPWTRPSGCSSLCYSRDRRVWWF